MWISCLGSEPGCSHLTASLNLLKSLLRAPPLHTRPRYFSFPLFVSGISHLENKDLRVEMSVICLPISATHRKLSWHPSASQMPERTAVTSRGGLNHQLPCPMLQVYQLQLCLSVGALWKLGADQQTVLRWSPC